MSAYGFEYGFATALAAGDFAGPAFGADWARVLEMTRQVMAHANMRIRSRLIMRMKTLRIRNKIVARPRVLTQWAAGDNVVPADSSCSVAGRSL